MRPLLRVRPYQRGVSNLIQVAAGAIEDGEGCILIARRPDHVHQGGLWEFPGGKLEPGESPEQGLTRELAEELGIRVLGSRPLIRVHHDYGDRRVLLDVRRVESFAGEPHGREGQSLAWQHPDAMNPTAFPAADRPIITALRLPNLYLITGPDPRQPDSFLFCLNRALEGGVRLVQLRAHGLSDADYGRLARRAFDLCEGLGARLMLNAPPAKARELPCHGLHLSGRRMWALGERPQADGLWIGASCHNRQDLEQAGRLGLDYALLSPVKPTRSHPGARPLGWEGFAVLAEEAVLPVFALGGLGPADVETAIDQGAQGVAAIRGLWPSSGQRGDSLLD
ncbi:MAG: Nudix family hydrolase [Pseudomonadota bacterium]|nr:Nudix family hydrolase [Pseudomonadota bacterium]